MEGQTTTSVQQKMEFVGFHPEKTCFCSCIVKRRSILKEHKATNACQDIDIILSAIKTCTRPVQSSIVSLKHVLRRFRAANTFLACAAQVHKPTCSKDIQEQAQSNTLIVTSKVGASTIESVETNEMFLSLHLAIFYIQNTLLLQPLAVLI